MQTRATEPAARGGAFPFVAGLGSGLAAAYFLDADRGRQRRAQLRDQGTSLWRRGGEVLALVRRDFDHRAQGVRSRARHLLASEPVSDDVLVERVRAELGRRVTHPHAVEVRASDGTVTLAGPILAREVQSLVRRVRRVRGVRALENRLDVHRTAGSVPGLQGETVPRARHRNVLTESWPPATRVVLAAGGLSAWLAGGALRRGRGYWVGTLGALLAWRALTNAPVRRAGRSARARFAAPASASEASSSAPREPASARP